MTVLAVIPARGGSRGIPGKNIKPLAGKPLIAWSIEAARNAHTVDRVVVSTDDDEIARVSRTYGAEVVVRPAAISGDRASSESALIHALDTLRQDEGYEPDVLAFLQCTAPLTTSKDIDGTVSLVLGGDYDSAVTMAPFHYFVWRKTPGGSMTGVNHDPGRRLMRQEREPEYLEVGAVYAMHVPGLLVHRHRFFGRIGKYVIPISRSIEIDDPDDWALAELSMRARLGTGPASPGANRWARVRAVVTDFDGVMTDNRVLVDERGVEGVFCHRGDGWGISLLKAAGIVVACISTEVNPVVRARCEKLDIPYWHGQHDKLAAFDEFLLAHDLDAADCVYVGNDTNDAACLARAGIAVVPADATPEVAHLAHWRTPAAGGQGVLRQVASRILEARKGRS